MTNKINLPVKYHDIPYRERYKIREQYIEVQGGKCWYCGGDMLDEPPKEITDKKINWSLFPDNFLQYPLHLQHDHNTGLTEGVVHAYCNAVLWQYERR